MVSTASAQQRRSWHFHRGTTTGPYCVRLIVSVDGGVDVDLLQTALDRAWREAPSAASWLAAFAIGCTCADGIEALRCEAIKPPRYIHGPDANDRLADWLLREAERQWASAAHWTPLAALVCPRSARRTICA